MAARTFACLLLAVAIVQAGCAGASSPFAGQAAARSESGTSNYPYIPFDSSATYAWSADYGKSMDRVNKVLSRDPGDPRSLLRRGNLYTKSAQFDKAEQDFDRAIDHLQLTAKSESRSATLAELHMRRALLKRERNARDAALADLNTAVELAPSYWEPRFHRWQLNRELGRSNEAEADREAGLKLNQKIFSQTYDSKRGVI